MVGGYDHTLLLAKVGSSVINRLLEALSLQWPEGVLESDSKFPVRLRLCEVYKFPWTVPCALFVYETEAMLTSWSEHGCLEVNQASLLHIYAEEDSLHFVALNKAIFDKLVGPGATLLQEEDHE